jgi:hypothetical protein
MQKSPPVVNGYSTEEVETLRQEIQSLKQQNAQLQREGPGLHAASALFVTPDKPETTNSDIQSAFFRQIVWNFSRHSFFFTIFSCSSSSLSILHVSV